VFKTKNQRKTVVTMYEIRMQLRELSFNFWVNSRSEGLTNIYGTRTTMEE